MRLVPFFYPVTLRVLALLIHPPTLRTGNSCMHVNCCDTQANLPDLWLVPPLLPASHTDQFNVLHIYKRENLVIEKDIFYSVI